MARVDDPVTVHSYVLLEAARKALYAGLEPAGVRDAIETAIQAWDLRPEAIAATAQKALARVSTEPRETTTCSRCGKEVPHGTYKDWPLVCADCVIEEAQGQPPNKED